MFECGGWCVVIGEFNFVEKELEFAKLVNGIGDGRAGLTPE